MQSNRWIVALAGVLALVTAACGPEDTGTQQIEIAGEYTDDFGTTHTFSNDQIVQSSDDFGTSTYHVTRFSNPEQFAIAHNDPSNEFNPDQWSRFDWTRYEDDLWFCQTAFDADSEQEALDTPRADDTDPSSGGCGGFEWTRLTPTST